MGGGCAVGRFFGFCCWGRGKSGFSFLVGRAGAELSLGFVLGVWGFWEVLGREESED